MKKDPTATISQKFLKSFSIVPYVVTLYRKFTRALTVEILCQDSSVAPPEVEPYGGKDWFAEYY
jgi:hypothetical protein